MADVLTTEQRKLNMSRIRGRDTNIELQVRKLLYAEGFRFRLHRQDLPGTPDLVLTKYRACIFIHGCFWHGHTCALFKLPGTRTEFWANKIAGNRARDAASIESLIGLGWRVLTVWECALRGRTRMTPDALVQKCSAFLNRVGRQSKTTTGVLP